MPPATETSKVYIMIILACSLNVVQSVTSFEGLLNKELQRTPSIENTISAIIEHRGNNTTTQLGFVTNISVLAYQQCSSLLRM
jgi:hypothetical protein